MKIDYELLLSGLRKLWEYFKSVMMDFIKSKWEVIKEYVNNYEPVYEQSIHPTAKNLRYTKTTIKSQVIMRKPRFICARTSC